MKWPKYWSFSFNTQDWSPLGWPGWIFLQSKGLSRVFYKSQLKRINSLALSFLYHPTLTSILDHWKNHSLDYMALCWQSNVSAFQYAIQIGHDKMKRQPINWKKIFANAMIDKGSIFKIYKQFIQLNNNNNNKNNKSNWKMNWLSEQTFSQRRYTDNKQAQEKKKFNIANHQRNTDQNHEDFLGGSVVKNPPTNSGDMGLTSGLGRSHMPWSN